MGSKGGLMRRHRWALLVAVAGLGLVLPSASSAQAQAPAHAPAPAPAPGPFDRPDAFCIKTSPPPGKRNSSAPGVTPNSITISDASTDSVALKKIGVTVADFHAFFGAFIDEVNRCGGVNGRKLVLKSAPTNPLAVDQVGMRTAMCLRMTEDQKAFLMIGIGNADVSRCVSVQHQTISFAAAYATSQDFQDSKGRIVSLYPAGDKLAAMYIADAVKQHTFAGKKVTVVGSAINPSAAQQIESQYIDELAKRGVDATVEMLPCVGTVCRSQVGAAVRRMKQNGTNFIVLSHFWFSGNIGALFREMKSQNLETRIGGPMFGTIHQDGPLAQVLADAGSDATRFVSDNGMTALAAVSTDIVGSWRTGTKETQIAKTCNAVLAKSLNQPVFPFSTQTATGNYWATAVSTCINIRAIARALHSLGNNVTTARMTRALADVELKGDRRDTAPVLREKYVFSALSEIVPINVSEITFRYPCPTKATEACMVPTDRPIRVRSIG